MRAHWSTFKNQETSTAALGLWPPLNREGQPLGPAVLQDMSAGGGSGARLGGTGSAAPTAPGPSFPVAAGQQAPELCTPALPETLASEPRRSVSLCLPDAVLTE